MRAFIEHFRVCHGKMALITIGLVLVVALEDVVLDIPSIYWGMLMLICFIVPATAASGLFEAEYGKDAIRFVEYLPVRRVDFWAAKYLCGLVYSAVCVLPCLVVRALKHGQPLPGGWLLEQVSERGNRWVASHLESAVDILANTPPLWLVLGGLALVFFWYALSFFVFISIRSGRTGLFLAFMLLPYAAFWLGHSELVSRFGLRPNLQELSPVLFSSGVLLTAGSWVAFRSFLPRPPPGRFRRAWVLQPLLFLILATAASAHFVYLCTRWRQPVFSEARDISILGAATDDGILPVRFSDRRSGEHKICLDVASGQVLLTLPWLSAFLSERYGYDATCQVPGTDHRTYVSGEGLWGLFPGTPRVVRVDAQGGIVAEIPLCFRAAARLYGGDGTPAWMRHLAETIGGSCAWRLNGRVLTVMGEDDESRLGHGDADAGAAEPRTILRIRDSAGRRLREYRLSTQRAHMTHSAQERLLIPASDLQHEPGQPYPETRPFILLDLATMRESRLAAPLSLHSITSDLSRCAQFKQRSEGTVVHTSLLVVDLTTGERKVVLSERDVPAVDLLKPRWQAPHFVFDRQLTQAAYVLARKEGTKIYQSLLLVDFREAKPRVLFAEDDLPRVDLSAADTSATAAWEGDFGRWSGSHSGAPYVSVQGFTPDGRKLRYAIAGRAYHLLDLRGGEQLSIPCGRDQPFNTKQDSFSISGDALAPGGAKSLRVLDVLYPGDKDADGPVQEAEAWRRINEIRRLSEVLLLYEYGQPKPRRLFPTPAQAAELELEAAELARQCGGKKEDLHGAALDCGFRGFQWCDDERIALVWRDKLWLVHADGSGVRRLFPPPGAEQP